MIFTRAELELIIHDIEQCQGIYLPNKFRQSVKIKIQDRIEYLDQDHYFSKFRYPDDVRRLWYVAIEYNLELTPEEVENLWDEFSSSREAGWLLLEGYSNHGLYEILIGGWDD
jgi:hypothetical protein